MKNSIIINFLIDLSALDAISSMLENFILENMAPKPDESMQEIEEEKTSHQKWHVQIHQRVEKALTEKNKNRLNDLIQHRR